MKTKILQIISIFMLATILIAAASQPAFALLHTASPAITQGQAATSPTGPSDYST